VAHAGSSLEDPNASRMDRKYSNLLGKYERCAIVWSPPVFQVPLAFALSTTPVCISRVLPPRSRMLHPALAFGSERRLNHMTLQAIWHGIPSLLSFPVGAAGPYKVQLPFMAKGPSAAQPWCSLPTRSLGILVIQVACLPPTCTASIAD
jgi:hypothetical protein